MITLTPEETRQFGSLFQQYEDSGSGVVNGNVAYPLFIKSGLSTDVLRQIWAVADGDNRGALDLTGFSKALRLIYHVQHGRPFGSQLVTIPAMLPRFDQNTGQGQGQVHAQGTGPGQQPQSPLAPTTASPRQVSGQLTGQAPSQIPAGTGTQIPPLGTADKARFGALFDKHARDGLIDGPSARDIFLKAKLSSDTLSKIWTLVSQGQGSLRRNEFILAMHLIQSTMSKQLTTIPAQLPESWIPWLHGKQSFVISPQDKYKFDQHFESLQQDGIVSAEKAADFLKKSNLSEDVLAVIWDLADYREQGSLDRSGFAIAMFLVNKKLGGSELPQRTPTELIESASISGHARGTSDASYTSVPSLASPQTTGRAPVAAASAPPASHTSASVTGPRAGSVSGTSGPPAPPSRTASGSMNDLVNLDDTFFAPSTNVKSPVLSPSSTGQKKETFVPKSSFGQSLVGQRDISGASANASPNIASAAEINRQHAQAQEQHAEAQQKFQHAQSQNKQATSDLESTRAAKQQLEREIGELRSKYDSEAAQVYKAQQEIKQLKEEMARLEKDHNLRKSGFQALTTQHRDLSTQLEDYRSKRDALAANVAELETQHTQHQHQLESMSREQQELQEHHSKHTSRLQSLEAELANLKNHIEGAHASRSAAEARTAESSKRADALESEVSKAREDLAAAQAKNEHLAKEAAEHEAREKNVREELSKLQQQKKQVDESIASINSRVQQAQANAKAQAEALAKAQSEAEAQSFAHAQAQSQARELESQNALSSGSAGGRALTGNSHANTSSTGTFGPAVGGAAAGIVGGTVGAEVASHLHHDQFDSPETSYKASTLSEQSSPRTSEFQINDDGAVPPSFTLPMARPQSATSSVANNPPQSVRGDNEDVSRPVSPEFSTSVPVNGINPPQNMEIEDAGAQSKLYAHAGNSSDSFEFVDAADDQVEMGASGPRGAPQGAERSADRLTAPGATSSPAVAPSTTIKSVDDESSSDDEGPESLPQLRQVTPGGTAVYSDYSSHITSAPAPAGTEAPPTPDFTQSRKVSSSASTSDHQHQGQQSATTSSAYAPVTSQPAATQADFGDAFDDLEEAIEDNSDEDAFNTTQQSHAEPDEWQQLFADSAPAKEAPSNVAHAQAHVPTSQRSSALQGPPVPKKNSPKLPELAGHESSALAELTSMGFPENAALEALRKCNFNPSEATNLLLDG